MASMMRRWRSTFCSDKDTHLSLAIAVRSIAVPTCSCESIHAVDGDKPAGSARLGEPACVRIAGIKQQRDFPLDVVLHSDHFDLVTTEEANGPRSTCRTRRCPWIAQ